VRSAELEVTSIGSGSCGNALLVRTRAATLLVDCGVGIRRFAPALQARGVDVRDVDALLITHEHGDHVRELPRFQDEQTQILCTRGSARALRLERATWVEMCGQQPAMIAGIEIVPIPVMHDAAEACGYLLRTAAGAITVLTDLGSASGSAAEAIAESRLVVLEANHDEEMLRRGPYPQHLQRRILSDRGHLSNKSCAELLVNSLRRSRRLPTVWLAHLSEANNRPHLAIRTVQRHLVAAGIAIDLSALPRRAASSAWRPDTARNGAAQLTLDLFAPEDDKDRLQEVQA
jgi:phosphoribosyl 1,2-cyclic phosphodiesterase